MASSSSLSSFEKALQALSLPSVSFDNFSSALTTTVEAFHSKPASSLALYKAASCLCESHLRQIAYLLLVRDVSAIPSLCRILLIIQGLPGNDEIIHNILSHHDCSSLDSLTLAILSYLTGQSFIDFCSIKNLLKRAFSNHDPDAKLALSILFKVHPNELYEHVPDVLSWDMEEEYANSPSFWREIKWAAFARSKSVPLGFSTANCSTFDATKLFEDVSFSSDDTSKQYTRICGILLKARSCTQVQNAPLTSTSQNINESSPFVITSSLHPILCSTTAAIAHSLPFLLEGPTGCGKTSLISFLAQKTMRSTCSDDAPGVTFVQMDSVAADGEAESFDSLVGSVVPLPEGGGFRWRPGPVGLAVQRGEWLVLENISHSVKSPSALSLLQRLANLQVGQFLEAPGRGQPIRVSPGFRCIATRTVENFDNDGWEPPGGWNLWLRFQIPALSHDDMRTILRERFPLVVDCISRIVDAISKVAVYTARHSGPIFVHPNMRQALRISNRLNRLRSEGVNVTAEIALQETLDTLVAWCSDDRHTLKLIHIVSKCWSLSSDIGNSLLSTFCPSYSQRNSALQIGRATFPRLVSNADLSCKLALNSHTLRLLERILRCLQMNENILLTGEAGSGKTAVIQELARILEKELVIVNLSRQSELTDLLGGFKPIEMAAIIPQVSRRFEELFCSCMSREKNVRFLEALQRAARTSDLNHRALRLMRGAINALPARVRTRAPEIAQKWSDIVREIESLDRSFSLVADNQDMETNQREPKESEPPLKRPRSSKARAARRIEFKFSEGVLVKAMKAGKWVLLDEINLAPSELLERLVSIVDKGQVVLSNENGDIVTQAPGFMLFGAMNPPTDAGKRPLPTVLRTRFSEFHVGDVLKERDITMLVLHRFFRQTMESSHTSDGNESKIAEDVSFFFLECCKMSREGRIEDTCGKPVRFSMRTLSRMLDFASGIRQFFKPGTDSIRRALFEGALVSFATSLPNACKNVILQLANKRVLRSAKSTRKKRAVSAMMAIPSNLSPFVHVLEGFPIEKHRASSSDTSKQSGNFIISPTVKKTLTDICRSMLIGAPKFPVLLQGPTAAGKTSIVTYMAELTGTELVRINNHEHTELTEYIGGYVVTADGALQFSEGPLVRAARCGHWVLLDELNLAPPDVLEALNRLLDDNREIFVAETGEVVKAAPGFRLFATQNPPGLYGGRKELSRAFRSRFVEVHVDELPDADLSMILEKGSALPKSFVKGMIAVMRELQLQRRSTGMFTGREGYVTARDLFRWASRQPRSREELAVYGFHLLGERARLPSEREVVRDVLVRELKISKDVINDKLLYSLNPSTKSGIAAQECLDVTLQKLQLSRERLMDTLTEQGIVATPYMSRMIVLALHCVANREPSLLVGATGSGKTSSCEVISAALHKLLLSVNCHRHTEASDIVGGFRPVRQQVEGGPLFEWQNGPLIEAMLNGHALLVDEINMADDAVIERLNSVLEHGRSFLLSEKGSCPNSNGILTPELIIADQKFMIFATMNPSGDFGKKELSPALRNRFTEIWMPQPNQLIDYAPIVESRLSVLSSNHRIIDKEGVIRILLNFLRIILAQEKSELKTKLGAFFITLRDLKMWCGFIVDASLECSIDPFMALVHGARLVFLDGLSVGSMETGVSKLEESLWEELLSLLPKSVKVEANRAKFADAVVPINWCHQNPNVCVEVDGFLVMYNHKPEITLEQNDSFSFEAPNTKRNTARLSRAMCVGQYPILLEGPPGGGKTSLVSALARKSKNQFVRVNLSESTEMSDLVGGDAPGERQGTFSFHEGPLLKAMKEGSWLLLDELNLASQSVLEGLNSVLDHRRSVFVPELNEDVPAHNSFRIFGAQNPAVEGSGRRGLPKSFLNRFTKVWVEPPDGDDILTIISSLHRFIPRATAETIVSVLLTIGSHSDLSSIPWSFGLRDALRWCDLLCEAGPFNSNLTDNSSLSESCVLTYMTQCFEVVVLNSLSRADHRDIAVKAFEQYTGHIWKDSRWIPSLGPNSGNGIRLGVAPVRLIGSDVTYNEGNSINTILPSSRISELQAFSLSLQHGWSTVLFSDYPSESRLEGLRLFQSLAVTFGKKVQVVHGGSLSNTDDFIGGYCQQDVVWIMRQTILEWRELLRKCTAGLLTRTVPTSSTNLPRIVEDMLLMIQRTDFQTEEKSVEETSESAESFTKSSKSILNEILRDDDLVNAWSIHISRIQQFHVELDDIICTVNARKYGSFEWRKSSLLTAIENGEWIFVEDADQCPPAVLDRLNPLFERVPHSNINQRGASRYPKKVLLAEAPTKDDGSPIFLEPHPEFRMVFAVSSQNGKRPNLGLSRALLDRSLRIYLGNGSRDADPAELLFDIGLHDSKILDDNLKNSSVDDNDFCTRVRRIRLQACLGRNYLPLDTLSSNGGVGDGIDILENIESKATPIPRTTPSQLLYNSKYALIERDICSLLSLETTSSKVLEGLMKKSLQLDHTVPEKVLPNENSFCTDKENFMLKGLLSAAMELVLMASYSLDDAKLRINRLKDLRKRKVSNHISSVYDETVNCFNEVISSISCHKDLLDIGLRNGLPLDPLYGLDFGAVALLECRQERFSIDKFQKVAKDFRVLTLHLQRLLIMWDTCQRMAAWGGNQQVSLFSQAQVAYELQEDFESNEHRMLNYAVLAYEIIRCIVKASDGIRDSVIHNREWSSPEEEQWMSVLSITNSLCYYLSSKHSILETSDMYALLIDWISCWSRMPDIPGAPEDLKSSSTLWLRARNALGRMKQAMKECGELVMPKTLDGQTLEAKLVSKIKEIPNDYISASEIDVVSKAVVTVRSKSIEENSRMRATLDKVFDSLGEAYSKKCTDFDASPVEHWIEITHVAGINALWKIMFQLVSGFKKNGKQELSHHNMNSILHLVKCIQPLGLQTVFSTQRIYWILSSHGSDDVLNINEFYKPFISSLLRASSSISKYRNSFPEDELVTEGITYFLMKAAKNGSKNQFWDLESAWRETTAALSLVICGQHSTKDSPSDQDFLLHSLVRALCDTNIISSEDEEELCNIKSDETKSIIAFINSRLNRPNEEFIGQDSRSNLLQSIQNLLKAFDSSTRKSFAKRKENSSHLFQFGILWLLIGILRLQDHYDFIKSLNGLDPCIVAQSSYTVSSQCLLEQNTKLHALEVIRNNRFGGDDSNDNIPVQRIRRRIEDHATQRKVAERRLVERPEGNSPFESYESMLTTIVSRLNRVTGEEGLVRKCISGISYHELNAVRDEIIMLNRSSEEIISSFDIGHSMSHFRDLSTDFELGLCQCIYGLTSVKSGLDVMIGVANNAMSQKFEFLSNMSLFPRSAFEGFTDAIPQVLKQCVDSFHDGKFLLGTTKYLIEVLLRNENEARTLFEVFDYVVQAWKRSLLSNEEEMERKSSLHILREASNANNIYASDVLERLEEDEEADYTETFNPISAETEEEMFGFFDETNVTNGTSENEIETKNEENPTRLKFDSNLFWNIYLLAYPSHDHSNSARSNSKSSLKSMISLSSQFYPAFQDVSLTTRENPSVWDVLLAHCTVERFSRHEDTSFNFYKSSNIYELAQASTILRSLLESIAKIQDDSFKESGAHPVLEEVKMAVERMVMSCKADSPLAHVVLGVENVLRKADEWHRLFATKLTRLDSDVEKLSRLVLRWRKLEMSSWKYLLEARQVRFQEHGSKWFFLLYDVIINNSTNIDKDFDQRMKEILSLVDQFLRSSPFGEFKCRVDMALSLANHLSVLMKGNELGTNTSRTLKNIARFYAMYVPGIEEAIKTFQKPIYKKLDEFAKLVRWTATEDLGSSQKMSKEKNKYLEYYRLKASSEKTRRRLHKLCLEVDAVLRKPSYDYLVKDIARIGLNTLTAEDTKSSGNASMWPTSFSHSIPTVCDHLSSHLVEKTSENIDISPPEAASSGLLSRVSNLKRKMSIFGVDITKKEKLAFSFAMESMAHIRDVIKVRVPELRSIEGQNIQKKQRSLVELLRTLRQLGLSPFRYESAKVSGNLADLLSTSSPSNLTKFDGVADELFMTCLRQVRRLREVYDARLRNADISKGEASRGVSFCNQLLLQSNNEREEMWKISSAIWTMGDIMDSLIDLEQSDAIDEGSKAADEKVMGLPEFKKLKDTMKKLRCIGDDIDIFNVLLKSMKDNSKIPTLARRDDSRAPNLNVSLRKHIEKLSADDLNLISKGIASCCEAISTVVSGEDVQLIMQVPSKATSLLRNGVKSASKNSRNQLNTLMSTLEGLLSSVAHLSSANLLNMLVEPALSFLKRQKKEELAMNGEYEFNVNKGSVLSKWKDDANVIVERILVSTQRTLNWAGVKYDEKEKIAEVDEKEKENGIFKNSILDSHQKLTTIHSEAGLSEILSLFSKNADDLEWFACHSARFSPAEKYEIINIQRNLGHFLQTFLRTILTPILDAGARYHCNALNLLRTLSSLFVGLFVDGYCRPADETPDQIEGDDKEVSGTGFGDADDGDMSGAQNVSDQIEDEEQLIGLQNDNDEQREEDAQNEGDNKEDGFEMTTDFEGKMEDAPEKEDKDENQEESPESDDVEKHMSGDQDKGKDVLNERLWGDGDERAEDAEDENDKGGDESAQKSTDLVAKDEDGDDENNDTKQKNPVEKDQKDSKANDGQVENEEGDGEEEKESKEPDDGDNSKEEDQRSKTKKGTDGQPLGDEENDESLDEQSDNDEGEGEGDELKGEDGEQSGPTEHKEGTEGADDAGDERNDGTEEGVDGNGDIEMEMDDGGNEKGDEEGDGDDEMMLGDSKTALDGSENMEQGEGDETENGVDDGDDLEGGVGDLDLGDLSSVDGNDEEDGSLNDGDDGDIDMENEKETGDDDEGGVCDNGDGNGEEANNNDEDLSKSMELDDGTATTSQAGGDGHQAFRADGQSSTNMQSENDAPPQDNQTAGERDMNSDGQKEGQGTGENRLADGDGRDGEKGEDGNQLEDPNPLRATAPEELIKQWENILEKVKQAKERNDLEGNEQGENDSNAPHTDEWRFQHEDEKKLAEDKVALGAATEDQHEPLSVDLDGDKNEEDEEGVTKHDGKDDNEEQHDNSSAQPNQSQSRNRGQDDDLSNKDNENDEKNADETDEKMEELEEEHPARAAASRKRDVTMGEAITNNTPAADEDREVTDDYKEEYGEDEDEVERLEVNAREEKKTETLSDEDSRELWRQLDGKVSADATILCEELRLVLEATERSGLGGSYRSGKRLNMRKVIEFVASDFRKDRIWMRRVRAERRSYDVMIAIDNSASMGEGQAGVLALEAVALVMSALTKLEVGRVAVTSFGATTENVRDFDKGLPMSLEDGGTMLRHFTFSQSETDVVGLMKFICDRMGGGETHGRGERQYRLVFIISDGHISQREEVRRRVRMLKDRGVLVALIIVKEQDADAQNILDVKRVEYDDQGGLTVVPYMEQFPVPFYVIVNNLHELPRVMAQSLRHWIELASS